MSYLNNFENILINVGYDEFIENKEKIKYPKYFLSNYNIEPYWVTINDPQNNGNFKQYLKFTTLENLLDNSCNNFFVSDTKSLVEQNKNFIYPIILYDNRIFNEIKNLEINDNLKSALNKNIVKIAIIYLTEGFFGQNTNCFDWIENFMKINKIDKNQLIIITSNFLAKEQYKKNEFQIIHFSFFSNRISFLPENKLDKSFQLKYENEFLNKIINNKNELKKKHFLCFNGFPKLHRLLMFGELHTNLKFKNKVITSLRGDESASKILFYEQLKNYFLNKKYEDNIKKYLNFYEKYDSTKDYLYDKSFWKERSDKCAGLINLEAHNSCFLNIVTETLHQENIVFFTEKTFKPIFCCQPFIIYGNCYTLKKLKEIGFKTFDKWWDESYDNEPDLYKRLIKIKEVLETISNWDLEYCREVLIEMEDNLIYNYKILMDTKDLLNLYQILNCENKKLIKNLI